jgi:hypothetical protein
MFVIQHRAKEWGNIKGREIETIIYDEKDGRSEEESSW